VLFSRKDISAFINGKFEAAWQSVRPAAVVRIDFGNGKTVTRTLNGNIATYVCRPDGTVIDVIPGVYDPQTYLERLKQARLLYQWATSNRRIPKEKRAKFAETVVRNYHRQQAESLRKHEEAKVIVVSRRPSILAIQRSMKLVLKSSLRGKAAGKIAADRRKGESQNSTPYKLPGRLSSRVGKLSPKDLRKDSKYNENVRRVKVHEYLAEHGSVKPAAITKWLYKNVLDTDLDDPYLGLGKTLFGSYPFKDENK